MEPLEYFTAGEIEGQFDQLNCKGKIQILDKALAIANHHIGLSRIECLAMAMGYENRQGRYNTYFKPQT